MISDIFLRLDFKLYLSRPMPILENGCTILISATTIRKLGNSFIDYLLMSPRSRCPSSRRL